MATNALFRPQTIKPPTPPAASTLGGTGAISTISTPNPFPATAAPAAPAAPPRAPVVGATRTPGTTGAPVANPFTGGITPPPAAPAPSTLQTPGQNMANPGYSEQGLEATQNRLLQDPYADQMQAQYQQTQNPSAGESYINQNLGSLDGPGQGEQYWNQQQGQFNSPFAGEQFARQATQAMNPQGPASAFFNQAQQQYGQFTGYQGPQAAQGQYQANAASGPNSMQQFNNQAQGDFATRGTYSDPNLAAGQYAQTQQAFGDLPVAEFDPFYDRARQLGVQSYNQNAAGRGVYGSSESLNGVGNVITDIEAQRANRSFDAEMQRAQEQRMRQGMLGDQARQGDLSSVAAFGANLAGTETYGNLANAASSQTTAQQTMLGNQANNVDTQALGAQEANLRGVDTYGNLSQNADSAETNRFNARTGAMRDADRGAVDRLGLGADVAFRSDDSTRQDYIAGNQAATNAGNLADQRTNTGIRAAESGSRSDLDRLREFGNQTGQAEGDRQNRVQSEVNARSDFSNDIATIGKSATDALQKGDQAAFEDAFNADIVPYLQAQGWSEQEIRDQRQAMVDSVKNTVDAVSD